MDLVLVLVNYYLLIFYCTTREFLQFIDSQKISKFVFHLREPVMRHMNFITAKCVSSHMLVISARMQQKGFNCITL